MRENKLEFTSPSEDKTIVIDKSNKKLKEVEKIYANIKHNLGFCHEQLKKGELTNSMLETHLSLTESYIIDFFKSMNYNSQLEKDKNKRFEEIRKLNQQNQDLRKQLGEKVSNEDVREKLKLIEKTISQWWSTKGFGHISEFYFVGYNGIKMNLSGMIFESRYNDDDTDEKKSIYLEEIGFEVYDKCIVSNDKNFKLLQNLLLSKYPSSNIYEIRTHVTPNGVATYRDIVVFINDLDDITVN